MELVTGRKGEAHVTSQQDRMLHQGVFGVEAYILNTGKKLRPEVQSSNEIRIRDGALMVQGAWSCVKINTYDSITIQNGTQGMKRIDLVVWQYVYNAENDTEYSEWNVIQGTPDEIEPHMPEYVQGDIQSGDNFAQVPYLAVHLDGINITEVRTLLEVIPDIYTTNKNLTENISELNRNISGFKIRTGIVRISAEAKKSGAATIEYNGFSEPPLIFLSPLTNWADTANFTVSPDIRTTTEGKIVYYNGAAGTNTLYVGWAAIGH